MKNLLLYLVGVIVVDFCLFPVELTMLPGANLKMLMALVGVLIFGVKCLNKRELSVSKTLLGLTLISCLISLIAFVSVTINNTNDFIFVTYFVSMLVWYFAAYTACLCVKKIHGEINVSLIGKYLVAVCVMQCVFALMIDNFPAFKNFVDSYFYSEYIDTAQLSLMGRIYGIGAALDIAGIRFACVLVILAHIMLKERDGDSRSMILYWAAFAFIVVIGDMISRTTVIGGAIALTYYVIGELVSRNMIVSKNIFILPIIIVVAIGAVIYASSNSYEFYEHLRFGFEGFFNYAEQGEWSTHSTDILQTMYRWPDNLKTWVIGDGLFEVDGHFYMFTDVGYIRFIFYFGIIGLVSFIALYVFGVFEGIRLSPEDRNVFIFVFIINMIVWCKVSTDTFVVLVLLLNACEFNQQEDDNLLLA